MATNSAELYGLVAVGDEFFSPHRGLPGRTTALLMRRKEIRRLIANWTVLLDDTRRCCVT